MGLTEKLGKMGIPGFRSGKKWKMVVATSVYLIAAISIYLVASALFYVLTTPQTNVVAQTSKDSSVLQITTPTPVPTMRIEEIKKSALTVSYDELMRNNEDYIGKPVYLRLTVIQVNEISKDNYVIILSTGDIHFVWLNYKGKRILTGDIVDVWGEVKGIRTYAAAYGGMMTALELNSLYLEVYQKAGDY